jgi:Zn finger protein HypA/HybF involved in hydrogenase expression
MDANATITYFANQTARLILRFVLWITRANAFYCRDCGALITAEAAPLFVTQGCPTCGGDKLELGVRQCKAKHT